MQVMCIIYDVVVVWHGKIEIAMKFIFVCHRLLEIAQMRVIFLLRNINTHTQKTTNGKTKIISSTIYRRKHICNSKTNFRLFNVCFTHSAWQTEHPTRACDAKFMLQSQCSRNLRFRTGEATGSVRVQFRECKSVSETEIMLYSRKCRKSCSSVDLVWLANTTIVIYIHV